MACMLPSAKKITAYGRAWFIAMTHRWRHQKLPQNWKNKLNFGSQLQIDNAKNPPPPIKAFEELFVTPIFAPSKIGCFETTFLVEDISVIPVPPGSLRAICWYLMGFMLNNIEASRKSPQPDQVGLFYHVKSPTFSNQNFTFTPTHQLHFLHFLLEENTPKKPQPYFFASIHPTPPHASSPSFPTSEKWSKVKVPFWDSTKIRGKESVSFGGWEHQQIRTESSGFSLSWKGRFWPLFT